MCLSMLNQSETHFKKTLNLFDSTSIVIGSMVGSGIFIVSADIARNVGSPGWLLVVWAITGIMTIFASLSFGELAGMMPQAGGIYVYLREAYSNLVGFLYGWTLFLVIQCGTIAAIGMAFARFLGIVFPWIGESNVLFSLGIVDFNATKFVAIISILFLTYINSRGIEEGKWIQNIFTFSKVVILLIFVAIGLFFIDSSSLTNVPFWEATTYTNQGIVPIAGYALFTAIAISMVGSLFSADAWYNITFTSGEVIKPKRTIPLSLFLGTFIVGILYFLVNVVYLKAIPLHGDPTALTVSGKGIMFASEDRVATAAMNVIMGKRAEIIMAIVVVISTFGCNNGIILSGARVYYAMARDGVFFKQIGILNRKKVPGMGLWVQAIWSILLCLSGSYGDLLDYVISAVLIFNVFVIGAIFILRKNRPDVRRPYKAFGYPIIPLLYIIMSLTVFIVLLVHKPQYTWPGFIIVIIGIPVYYLWKHVNRDNVTVDGIE